MKKLFVAILLITFSCLASAEGVVGLSYSNFDADEANLEFGILSGSLGYGIDLNNGFSVMPEVRLGTGVSDDSTAGVDFEIDRVFVFLFRGEYDFGNGAYVFAAPSYANLKATGEAFGMSVSEDDWEFGIGGGLGYHFIEPLAGEASFESFDGDQVLSLSLRYHL